MKLQGIKEGDIVKIRWYDAYFIENLSPNHLDIPGSGMPMESVGQVVATPIKKLAIAQTHSVDDWQDVLIVPVSNIVSLEVLEVAD